MDISQAFLGSGFAQMFGQIGFGLQLGRLVPLGPTNMPAVSLSLSFHGNEEFKTDWCVPSTLSTESDYLDKGYRKLLT